MEEAIKEYRIKEEEEAGYFLKNEYPAIHRSDFQGFLPVSVREKNGKISAVYDLGGKMSMEEWLKGDHELRHDEVMKLIEAFVQLMMEVEEHLLVIDKVKISCRDIYLDREGNYYFLYMPERDKKMKESLEKFFNWVISKVDYSDERAVKLAYELHWHVRHEGFRPEIFGKYLDSGEKAVRDLTVTREYQPMQVREPASFQEAHKKTSRELSYEKDPEIEVEAIEKPKKYLPKFSIGKTASSKMSRKPSRKPAIKTPTKAPAKPSKIFSRKVLMLGEGLLGAGIFLDLAIAGVVGVAGYQQGFPPIAVRYLAICVVVGIALSTALKKIHDMRLATPEDIEKRYGAREEEAEEDYFPI